jgi:hypothetical protein
VDERRPRDRDVEVTLRVSCAVCKEEWKDTSKYRSVLRSSARV